MAGIRRPLQGDRSTAFDASLAEIAARIDAAPDVPADGDRAIADDRLRLVFTCCHPALPPDARVVLTLREVCDLTTEEIAHAFLVPASTLAQRIARAKGKIRDARLSYGSPSSHSMKAALEQFGAVSPSQAAAGRLLSATPPVPLRRSVPRRRICWSRCFAAKRRSMRMAA